MRTMQRFWTQQRVPWTGELAAMLLDAACEATTWTPNDAFATDRLTRAQTGTRTHFRVDHRQGFATFAIQRPIMGAGTQDYQRTLREKLEWSAALLKAWGERVRACPRNDYGGGVRPKGPPARHPFPVALYGSLRAALAGIPHNAGAEWEPRVRLVLDRFVADRANQFPPNTAIVLKRGAVGTAIELIDRKDERAIAEAWDAYFGRVRA